MVRMPLGPLVGAILNQGDAVKAVQAPPVEVVTWILCGGGKTPPTTAVKLIVAGKTVINGVAVGLGVAVGMGVGVGKGIGVGVGAGAAYITAFENKLSNPDLL